MRSSVATRYQLGVVFHAGGTDGATERRNTPGHLRVGHERGLVSRHVGREGCMELRRIEEQIALLRGENRRDRCTGRRIFDERGHGLAGVRSKRRDVDKPLHAWIGARFRDHHTAVRVADKNRGAVLLRQHASRDRDVVGQRRRRILDDAHVMAVLLQDRVDRLPSRAVHKTAMNENDVDRVCAVHLVFLSSQSTDEQGVSQISGPEESRNTGSS